MNDWTFGLSWFDAAALAIFLACWLGYGPFLRMLARGGVLNLDMDAVRLAWMRAMCARESRIVDGQLLGHTINSASFFASANLILIAAVGGVLSEAKAPCRRSPAWSSRRPPGSWRPSWP